jgi:hypothetical protein
MPTQRQIEQFTLAFHQRAIARLRDRPERVQDAIAVLDRWESIASESGRTYRNEWRQLLQRGVSAVESAVCVDTEHAATLRSTSPLGFLLDQDERLRLRREAMAA